MLVTGKGILLFIIIIVIPSVLLALHGSEVLFSVGIFLLSLIGIGVLYYYSKVQKSIGEKFDQLIKSDKDFTQNVQGKKFNSFLKQYHKNRKYIIENKDEIIIYPSNLFIDILGIIKFLKTPSYQNKVPYIRINMKGILHQEKIFCSWKDFNVLVEWNHPVSAQGVEGTVKSLKIVKIDGSCIIIPIEGVAPIRIGILVHKIRKFISTNKLKDKYYY